MWVSQEQWKSEFAERSKLVAELSAAHQLAAAQKSTVEWLMLRVTQLETERAKLLWKYMGVQVPVPEVAPEPAQHTFDNPLNALPNFNDIGDIEAAKRGIGWNENGELVYGDTKD